MPLRWLVLGSLAAVLGLLVAAILAPGYVKVRPVAQRSACIANLKQIDVAVQQWGLENKKLAAATYSFGDRTLLQFLKSSALPQCPAGGRYLPGSTVTNVPRCTIPGHTL